MSGVIAVLVVVGVLAAMLGDRLGHRLGKKRVSLFKLRPRHSGLLATCVGGGFLALILSPLALWSAGLFTAAPEPQTIRVPVVIRPQPRTDTPIPVAAEEQRPVMPHQAPPRVAGGNVATKPARPDARLQQMQRQLASAQAQIRTLESALAQHVQTASQRTTPSPKSLAELQERDRLETATKGKGNEPKSPETGIPQARLSPDSDRP